MKHYRWNLIFNVFLFFNVFSLTLYYTFLTQLSHWTNNWIFSNLFCLHIFIIICQQLWEDQISEIKPPNNTSKVKNFPGGMLGGWWFGGSPSSPDSNFLRVVNAFPNRRLSDNTLMTPKIRIAPSCASSPGGTPGGGLPIRRHSSIGPQERRGSTVNLSPPTVRTI